MERIWETTRTAHLFMGEGGEEEGILACLPKENTDCEFFASESHV
jgi:hypothetical protein